MLRFETSKLVDYDLEKMEPSLQKFFIKHMEKISKMPPRRHMRRGLPWHVEEVTKQARLVYKEDGETLYVIRCFPTHKEYEKWYKQFV